MLSVHQGPTPSLLTLQQLSGVQTQSCSQGREDEAYDWGLWLGLPTLPGLSSRHTAEPTWEGGPMCEVPCLLTDAWQYSSTRWASLSLFPFSDEETEAQGFYELPRSLACRGP